MAQEVSGKLIRFKKIPEDSRRFKQVPEGLKKVLKGVKMY